MTDFYSHNRCVCSTRSHGPLLCAFCLSFHFNVVLSTQTCSSSRNELISLQYNMYGILHYNIHVLPYLRPFDIQQ